MNKSRRQYLQKAHKRLEKAINRQKLVYDESRFRTYGVRGLLVYLVKRWRDGDILVVTILREYNYDGLDAAQGIVIERATWNDSELRALTSAEQQCLGFEEDDP